MPRGVQRLQAALALSSSRTTSTRPESLVLNIRPSHQLDIMSKFGVGVFLFILILTAFAVSADEVSQNGITISSDKSVYNCEPIFSEKGCLIRATITVTNDNPDTTYTLHNSFSTASPQIDKILDNKQQIIQDTTDSPKSYDSEKIVDVSQVAATMRQHGAQISQQQIALADSQNPGDLPLEQVIQEDTLQIAPDEILPHEILAQSEPKILTVEFWAKESGKFNIQVDAGGIGIIVLDPIYNVSPNPIPNQIFNPIQETTTDEYNPTLPYYHPLIDGMMTNNYSGLPYNINGYQKFNLSGVNSNISNITLALNIGIINNPDPAKTLNIYYCNSSYDLDFMTWNDAASNITCDLTPFYSIATDVIYSDTITYTMPVKNYLPVDSLIPKVQADADKVFILKYVLLPESATGATLVHVYSMYSTNLSPELLINSPPSATVCGAWSERTDTAGHDWTALASSSDGSKLLSMIYGGDIYTSTDSGLSWTDRAGAGSRNWAAGASSADGSQLVAVETGGDIYTSSDSGLTWTDRSSAGSRNWAAVASSSNGSKIIAITFDNEMVTSSDSGITWVNQTGLGGSGTYSVSDSYDGSKIASYIYNDYVYTSTDSGVSWLSHTELGTNALIGVAISGDGMKLVTGTNDAQVYVSTDFGTTWNNHSTNLGFLNGISMSKDGSTIAVWQATGNIFISKNLGNSWVNQTSAGSEDWAAMAFSYNGSKVVAGAFSDTSGAIWAYESCASNCTPIWVAQYGLCQSNDTLLKTYSDSNVCGVTTGLPIDNGTESSCNYCSEDLERDYTGLCQIINGTPGIPFIYEDQNYFSCCAITNLPSDCDILSSPFNESNQSENCTVLYDDFIVETDDQADFGFGRDKVFGKAYLNGTTGNYSCISYVKTTDNQVIQTNPSYSKANNALLQSSYDDRQYFAADNGLVNVYWTNENLVIDGRQYVFGIDCAGATRLRGEKLVIVGYESLNAPVTRLFWVNNNIMGLVLGAIFLCVIVFIIGLVIYRRSR